MHRRAFLRTAGQAAALLAAAHPGATPPAPAKEGVPVPMKVLRTPEQRFTGLDGYAFTPNYLHVKAGDGVGVPLRVHYLDERPADPAAASGETVLLLHGEPSWSYLYRRVIPPLVAAGHRCVAPDLVGFGRSDKPADRSAYTYQRHLDWLREAVLDRLDLRGVTLVCHDWGGLLGLRLLAEHPDRFTRVVATNTFLPTGDVDPGEGFRQWREFSQAVPVFDAGAVVEMGTNTQLTPEVKAAYNAPFPDETYKAGARQFPMLVPTTPDDPASEPNRRAWQVLEKLETPLLCAFSDQDWASRGDDRHLRDRIPGAKGQPPTTFRGANHFVQEDRPAEFAAVIAGFIDATR